MTYKVGRVIHFYDKLKVAIIELENTLAVGDTIKFSRGGEDLFEQKIESLQVEHQKVEVANKNDVVGIKTENEIKEGAEVYKL